MKQNRDYSYIFAKAETGKKYLLKWENQMVLSR
jgi:hypothetical protein